MIVFPNCKINLGLHISGKRNDGFHNLETVFYPVPLYDVLEIIKLPNTSPGNIKFTLSGFPISQANDNICKKSYELIKNNLEDIPSINLHLHKSIPIGAGLGGGSSDGAFTLKLLNELLRLNLSQQQLTDHALQLGSDCPFFIINKPCIASGRGEILEALDIDLSGYRLLIINPGININTGWAFSQLQHFTAQSSIKEIVQQPVETWKQYLQNDFEKPVFKHYPEIEIIKQQLYEYGAVYASLSGSGSSVYGLFKNTVPVQPVFPGKYFTAGLRL